MKRSKLLLKRFAGKGGILGSMASLYLEDPQKSTKFLYELKDQLKKNKQLMVAQWGEKLIRELEQFD